MRLTRIIRYIVLPLIAVTILFALPMPSSAQVTVGVSVAIAPPPLPTYVQPLCPGVGYIWTPGYWAYGDAGYYWVPAAWVAAPFIGALWTPGYWAWTGSAFAWNEGYWGPAVGFYGGINYGFGYVGVGYLGGRWNGAIFEYNTSVNWIDPSVVHNTYEESIPEVYTRRVSYNGGAGGIQARPTEAERVAYSQRRIGPTAYQSNRQHLASTKPALSYSQIHERSMERRLSEGSSHSGASEDARTTYRSPTEAANDGAVHGADTTAHETAQRSVAPARQTATRTASTRVHARPAPHAATATPRPAPAAHPRN